MCYTNVIGLAGMDCTCSEVGRPTDYDVSESGLYIDDVAEVNALLGMAECGADVWALLRRARDQAVLQFIADTNALLLKNFKLKRPTLGSERIGSVTARHLLPRTRNHQVLILRCAPIRGSYIHIRKIAGSFSPLHDVILHITDNAGGDYGEVTLSASSPGRFQADTTGLKLPLFSSDVPVLEYYITRIDTTAAEPRATIVECNCGDNGIEFDRERPYYDTFGPDSWKRYAMVGGLEIDDLTELDTLTEREDVANYTYGLSLTASIGCDTSATLCADGRLDFDGNPMALAIAFAIRHKAIELIASKLLTSTQLTRENLINSHSWEQLRADSTTAYNDQIRYIVSEIHHTATDCYTCKDVLELRRQGLFS